MLVYNEITICVDMGFETLNLNRLAGRPWPLQGCSLGSRAPGLRAARGNFRGVVCHFRGVVCHFRGRPRPLQRCSLGVREKTKAGSFAEKTTRFGGFEGPRALGAVVPDLRPGPHTCAMMSCNRASVCRYACDAMFGHGGFRYGGAEGANTTQCDATL